MERIRWSERLGGLAKWLGVGAVAIAFAGSTLARYDLIGKLQGFAGVAIAVPLALLGLLAAALSLLLGIGRSGGLPRPAAVGLVLSGAYLALIASYVIPARNAPLIHDVTTNLDDPPDFIVLPLRKDNLVGVGTVENWRRIHARAYPDLKTIIIPRPVAQVIADANRIARRRGWNVALADPERGRFEATAYVAWIRFKDDVVLRVKPTADGKGSVVDMRSVSQVGGGDLGYNARRIRSFLRELQQG
ncbi:MAG: DUF1499 domain-containing protein [Novosphingobium sp.]|nr:DUF1499 domain-containing protein [Novosphingobium sp.]